MNLSTVMTVVVTLALALLVGVSLWAFAPNPFQSGGASSGRIVVVDITRIVNAQRMLISSDLNSETPGEGAMLANRAGQLTEQTILEVAGEGAVVLIKQAVVGAETMGMDITDEVLERLALPADARGIGESAVDQYHMRGTEYSGSRLYRELEEKDKARARAAMEYMERDRAEQAGSILP